jgi:hypothetical protein
MPTQKKSKEKKPKKAKDEDSDDYSGGRLLARPPAPPQHALALHKPNWRACWQQTTTRRRRRRRRRASTLRISG